VRFAVFIPVGPNPADLRRVEAVTESLNAHVGSDGALILLNDGPADRDLQAHVLWNSAETLVIRAPLAETTALPNDRMAATTLAFLHWLAEETYDYSLKLDTDALVIGDFRPALESAFADSTVGVCGACERSVSDGPLRDLSFWRRQLLLACSPVQVRTAAGPSGALSAEPSCPRAATDTGLGSTVWAVHMPSPGWQPGLCGPPELSMTPRSPEAPVSVRT
jgi:hypothetical protein